MALRCAVLIAVLTLLGCGSKPGAGTTAARQPSAPDQRLLLVKCLKQANIRVVESGNVRAKGRVPRVPVPARYVGAAVLPRGGVVDLWLADSRSNAVKAAAKLNATLLKKRRSVAGQAEVRGKAVSALAAGVGVGDLSDAAVVDRCLAETTR
jgi:hypothetical protein